MLGGTFLSIYTIKYINTKRRDDKYKPEARITDRMKSSDKKWDYYDNLAHIKPGFPIKDPRDMANESDFKRKSKFEAGGVAAVTRKRGDRLGFWDRKDENKKSDN